MTKVWIKDVEAPDTNNGTFKITTRIGFFCLPRWLSLKERKLFVEIFKDNMKTARIVYEHPNWFWGSKSYGYDVENQKSNVTYLINVGYSE